jgi:hypothetical protein
MPQDSIFTNPQPSLSGDSKTQQVIPQNVQYINPQQQTQTKTVDLTNLLNIGLDSSIVKTNNWVNNITVWLEQLNNKLSQIKKENQTPNQNLLTQTLSVQQRDIQQKIQQTDSWGEVLKAQLQSLKSIIQRQMFMGGGTTVQVPTQNATPISNAASILKTINELEYKLSTIFPKLNKTGSKINITHLSGTQIKKLHIAFLHNAK